LEELGRGDSLLTRVLPARPGQKERRYIQLFSAERPEDSEPTAAPVERDSSRENADAPGTMEAMAKEIAGLRAELDQLREEFAVFRRQFE